MTATPPIEQLPCAAGTMRRASRSLARLYDAHLSHAGLTTTQFSILKTLERSGGRMPLGDLADELVFERTSLYRALVPMRRTGLITVQPARDRRVKAIALTARAGRKMSAAMPHWVAAQRSVIDEIGSASWLQLAARLGHLTAVARAAHSE